MRRIEIGTENYGDPAFDEALRGDNLVHVRLTTMRDGKTYVGRRACFPYASCWKRTVDLISVECANWLAHSYSDDIDWIEDTQSPRVTLRVTPLTWCAFVFREMLRMAAFGVRYAFEEVRWDIGVARSTLEEFIDRPSRVRFHWLIREGKKKYRNKSFADPMFTAIDGRLSLVCERIGPQGAGSLARINLDNFDGSHQTLLDDGTHASYPFVFSHKGDEYVIPERACFERIDLYKLIRTAGTLRSEPGLEFIATLIPNFAALDATILQFRGRWWLFATDAGQSPNAALHLFHAADLHGPWLPHRANPVKIDIRSARSAGRPFVHEGRLFRPAQDCSGRYGRALAINEITRLDPDGFSERTVTTIDVAAIHDRRKTAGIYGAVGVHTLSHRDGWIAVDAQFIRWSPIKPFALLRDLLRRKRFATEHAREPQIPEYAS